MKKLLFLLVLLLVLSSGKCKEDLPPGTTYVVERTFNADQEGLALQEVYSWVSKFELDSLELNQWINTTYTNDRGSILQRMIITYTDTAQYDFIYTTFFTPDSTWYQFKIRKKLKQ